MRTIAYQSQSVDSRVLSFLLGLYDCIVRREGRNEADPFMKEIKFDLTRLWSGHSLDPIGDLGVQLLLSHP